MADIDSIRKFCLSFPDTTENMQWGETLCFKVRGKMFAVVDLAKGKLTPICLKCSPDKFQELLEVEGIVPAPYVGRYKWVLVSPSNLLPMKELQNLIRLSYGLVDAKAPRKKLARKATPKKRRSR